MSKHNVKEEIKRYIEYLHPDKRTFELCAMKPEVKRSSTWGNEKVWGSEIIAGWFDDIEKVANLAEQLKKVKPEGTYVSLNPCKRALHARANGKLKANINRTKDDEIIRIKNILIDIDSVRPSGISATKKEHKRTIKRAEAITKDLKKHGWPTPLTVDSGNGVHLIFKTDLENNDQNVRFIKRLLNALALKYNSPKVKIDEKVFNPGRLVKLPGTYTRKGEELPDRPHRRARIIKMPQITKKLKLKHIEAMISTMDLSSNEEQKPTSPQENLLDVEKYLKHYKVRVGKVKQYRGGKLFSLEKCLFNEAHAPNKAAICQSSEGILYYQCFHNSCLDKKWSDARRKISGKDDLDQFYKNSPNSTSRNDIHYSIMSGSELINQQIKQSILINGLLEKNGSLLIIGPTGMMKSMLTLNIALNLAKPPQDGRLWGLFDIVKPARTLFIQSENGIYGTQKRIKLMVEGNGRFDAGLKKIFFPSSRKDCKIVGDLKDKYFQETLKEMIFATKARLIVLDPLISFHNHNENDNAEIRKVLDALTELSDVTQTASLLVHHTGKAISGGVFAGRGASAISDWASNILVLSNANPKTDSDGDRLIMVDHVKGRNFQEIPPFMLKVSGRLQFTKADSPIEMKLNIVVTALESLGGKVYDQGALKEAIMKQGAGSRAKAQRLIKDAVAAGLIEEKKKGKKMHYRFPRVIDDVA